MNDQELTDRLEFAKRIALEAGELTLRYYRQDDLQVETKSDDTPVTIADREAEQLLRKRIEAEFSDDAILGEEFGERAGTSGYRWILDPIDGTKSFMHGVPLYGNLIGVEQNEQSVIGVINLPAQNEYLYAARGHGSWLVRDGRKPKQNKVSTIAKLAEGAFSTTSVSTFHKQGTFAVYEGLRQVAGLARCWGDCYGYTLVASGRCELMIDPMMNLWDVAALQPVVEEAGGTFTDWNGQSTIYCERAFATNGLIKDEVLEIVQRALGK